MKFLFSIANSLTAVMLVVLLQTFHTPSGVPLNKLEFLIPVCGMLLEILFLILACLLLALRKPRQAILVQGLALLCGLITMSGYIFPTLRVNLAVTEALTSILLVFGLPILMPPILSLFLLLGSMRRTERLPGTVPEV